MHYNEFYEQQSQRLRRKMRLYNEALCTEPTKLLHPVMCDYADLNAGGKMLRGSFVCLGYALAKEAETEDGIPPEAKIEKSDALALAFELFQTAVLVHDDLIDHATLRRGKKTLDLRFSERASERGLIDHAGDTGRSVAICAGDLGLFESADMIVKSYPGHTRLSAMLSYFYEVVKETIRGEMLDSILPCEITDPTRSEAESDALLSDAVTEIYLRKTAMYSVVGPLHLGMLYGGADEELLAAVDAFAKEAGIAFQIKDDILGIFGSEEGVGKDVGSDVAEAKLTILYQYVRSRHPSMHEELMRDYGKSPVTPEALARVRKIFRESGAKQYAERQMEACFARAEAQLLAIPLRQEKKKLLRGLLHYLQGREN